MLRHSPNIVQAQIQVQLGQAQAGVAAALAAGDMQLVQQYSRHIRILNGLLNQLQRAQRAQPKGFVQRLGQFARTSRFAQSGFHPLLGRTLDVIGAGDPRVSAAVMGIVLASQAASAALRAFTKITIEATRGQAELRQARLITGGTSSQVSLLAAMGLGVEGLAGMARGLREQLAGDPHAMAAGARLGLGAVLPRPYGRLNEAELMMRVMDRLSQSSNMLQDARAMELDALVPLISSYQRHRRVIMADAKAMTFITDTFSQGYADLQFQLGRLGRNFQMLMQSIIGPAAPHLARVIGSIAEALRHMAEFATANPQIVENFVLRIGQAFKVIIAFFETISGIIFGDASPWRGAMAGFSNLAKAASAQTAATINNTAALGALSGTIQAGMYGGGQRLQGFLPGGLRGELLRRAIEYRSLQLGAFTA